MSKVLLIVNPSAGGEKAKSFEDLAKKKLESFFDEVMVKHTEKGGDAAAFAKEAAEDRYDSVFVMGGDGTVNEGISGLAELDYRPNFGFFPLGTVNDLARALGIPLDSEEAIQNLDINRVKPLDIGKVNQDYFMNVVAIGTIPESINNVDPEEKTKWGKLAYFISGFKQLRDTSFYEFRLTIDGEERTIKSSTLLIGSTNSIGGFESILPDAAVNDGLLHLLYFKDKTLLDTLAAVPELITGHSEESDNIEYLTFKEIRVELVNPEAELSVNVDGDEGDELPVTIRVLPSHLNVYY
ncbi:diacylglycerol/lipid kinase family protein [Streptococcus panodentis]|uniref:Diacylglycerol kinase n=1 Tax=Streptococcus panodentis TaxID=1581472 RepID=A0ABS5AWD5_9STRE|nr:MULTISPECIES: diacylglycerol kinase family protein [Streptococcus]KXT84559.1 diacylglycerol kinase catalytic domain protein [Streptococcus sp. DD11]MBP2620892.1 diacylglycerol kinase [Streptococcus panodentis]